MNLHFMKITKTQRHRIGRKFFALMLIVVTQIQYFPLGTVLAQTASESALEEQAEATMSAAIKKLSPEQSLTNLSGLTVKKTLPTLPSFYMLPRHRGSSLVLGVQSQSNASAAIARPAAVQKLSKKHFKSNEDIAFSIANAHNQQLDISVLNPDGNEADVEIAKEEHMDSQIYTIAPRTTHFKPGKYTLIVEDANNNTSKQDFTWGVLAINTNKSIYTPNERVDIAIAVLNESGEMVCDARVELEVTGPNNLSAKLSTKEKSIIVNSECTSHAMTLKPDYEAHIQTEGVGYYTLRLTAESKNGVFSITDGFEVKESLPFEVERTSATRIYPPHTYPVIIGIKANQDFTGTVNEIVPGDFVVTHDKDLQGYDSIERVALASEEKAVLGATVPSIIMPFKGDYPVSLGFGDHLIDEQQKDLYAQFGVVGHDGIDFDMPTGTEIIAVDDGEILIAEESDYGNTVVIQHKWGKSYYGHLSDSKVSQHDKVKKGEIIALSGNSGITTGPHLHFGIKPEQHDTDNGYYGKIDPSFYLGLKPQLSSVLGVSTSTQEDGDHAAPDLSQAENDNMQLLTWRVNLKKGDTIRLGYNYKAPEISPQFYTVGPATFVSRDGEKVFQEERAWQIAADAIGGQTVLYFHTEASDFNSASGSAVMGLPEANTTTAITEGIGVGFTGYPCKATNVVAGTTEVEVDMDGAGGTTGEKCVHSFFSSPVGQAMTIEIGDTLIATTSAGTLGNGNTADVRPIVNFYRYVSSNGTYEQFGRLQGTLITAATAVTAQTIIGAANNTRTFAAADRIVIVLTVDVTALDTSGASDDRYAMDFDKTSFPGGVTIYHPVIAPSKPDLTGTADDDFNPTIGSAGSFASDAKVVNASKWYWGTSTGRYSLGGNGTGNASGSAQWLRLENAAPASGLSNFGSTPTNTYVYQPADTNASGSGTITTVVNSSMPLTEGNTSGLLLWRSNTDYLIVQASSSGTARFVSTNNSGTINNPNTLSSTFNRIWLRWTKTRTTYTASYSTDGTTFTDVGTFAHGTTFTRVGLTVYSNSASTNYSGAFEYFDYNIGNASYTQGRYRWYENADQIQPTTALNGILENETTALTNTSPIRLRVNQTAASYNLPATAQAYKLQYTTDINSSWTDVADRWCNDTSNVTCTSDWTTRRKITFDNSALVENLTNFPVMVKLSSASGNIDFDKTKFGGEDIRFVDASDPNTVLPHEIEEWNEPAGEAIVWVKVPQIDAGSTTDHMWMYYGNGSISDGQDSDNTWDSDFEAVWHMDETSGTTIDDSTALARNGTKKSATEPGSITGKVDGAQNFDGTDDFVNAGTTIDLSGTAAMTLSAWVDLDTAPAVRDLILSNYDAGTAGEWWFAIDVNRNISFLRECGAFGTLSNSLIPLNTLTHVTATYDGTSLRIYIDGVLDKTAADSCSITNTAVETMIGAGDNGATSENNFDGIIDEARISTAARSGDWIKAEYLSQIDAMNTFGSEETQTAVWKFNSNVTPAHGAQITTNLLSTSTATAKESYTESNPTALNPAAIAVGETAEWDFALDPSNATAGTTYYFRMVLSDGTSNDFTYSVYPAITIGPSLESLMLRQKFFTTQGVRMPFQL